jgi:CRP/FNR family transcriptional regulator
MSTLTICSGKTPVFAKLAPEDRTELIRRATRKTYNKGSFICLQGDLWPYVLQIGSGRMGWVMLSPDGKRHVVFRLGACDVVWGHTLFDGKPMPASLEVMETSEVYLWPEEIIRPILSRNVEALWEVTRELVTSMRQVREVVYGFAFHPVAGRLARLLLDHYQPVVGQPTPRDLTLDEMAASVGTTRELVSKTLHRFADDGMIEISRMQFVFTDRGQLEQLAGRDE